MYDVPSGLIRHLVPPLRADEQPDDESNDPVKDADGHRKDHNSGQNNRRVVQDLLFRRPDDLLDLALLVAEELADPGEERLLFSFFCHAVLLPLLFGFFVKGVFLAESAILVHLKSVGVVFLVLHGIVVALLAFGASQSDFYPHVRHLL